MPDEQKTKQWFSQMVKSDMDAMYRAAMRLTGEDANAQDLVAETVGKAWACIGTLEDRGRWRPWVFRILRNTFISNYRKQSVRPLELPLDEQGDNDTESVTLYLMEQPDSFLKWWADPERDYVNKLLGEQIHAAIKQLPDVFRMTILLINVEGFSYDEAAAVLGVPRGTVRSRMKRGRTLLQKALWRQAHESGLAPHPETSRTGE